MNEQRVPDAVLRLVEDVRQLPYGRPSKRTVTAMLEEGRGTCSLKHRYLADALAREHPALDPRIVHRVYRVTRREAKRLHGPAVADAVPADGLTDVHRYLTVALGGDRIAIDATFPGPPWDGRSSMPLACGPGADEECAGDPDARKRELERDHCDPEVREPFIAALARVRRAAA